MNRAIILWLFILFGVVAVAADFKGKTVPLSEKDKDNLVVPIRAPKTVTPGKFTTFILEVKNPFSYPLDLMVNVDMPSSWSLLSKISEVKLSANETKKVVFLIEVDRACEIGSQRILFLFEDKASDFKIEEEVFTEVENIHDVRAKVVRKPRYVTSNQKFSVDFEITNFGNCEEKITVTSLTGDFINKEVVLPPKGKKLLQITKRSPADIQSVTYISLGITYNVSYLENQQKSIITVKAFPEKTVKADKYHRIPMKASVIYFGARTNGGQFENSFQGELKGKGYFDQNKRHEIDFTFRAPDQFKIARVGTFDQYSAEYTYHKSRLNKTTIRVGDFNYSLTDVTEMMRFARGIGISQKINKWEVGGFVNSPRFIEGLDFQVGMYAKNEVRENWTAQVGFMQKFFSGNVGPATLFTFKNNVKWRDQEFELDLSPGTQDGENGFGGTFKAQGGAGNFSYSSSNIYASRDYPGFFKNSIFSNNTVNYRIGDFSVFGSIFYNESNPNRDTIFAVAPYSIVYRAGLSYKVSDKFRNQISFIRRIREDRLPTRKFAYRENAVRYILSYNNKKTQIQGIGEIAETENLLLNVDDNTATTYLAGITVNRELFGGLSLSAFSQYLYTNRYASVRESLLFYGGGLGYRFRDNLNLRATYRNNYLIEEYTTDRTLLDVNLNTRVGNHEFDVTASQAILRNSLNNTDVFVRATYTYHIGVPTQRKEGLYSLDGQVNGENKEDVSGIIVTIAGQSVITDAYGHFVVNDLPEGVHYMYIDYGSIGLGLIPDIETPTEIFIRAEGNNQVVFNMVRGATLSGNLNIEQSPKEKYNKEELPRKIVKVSNGKQEYLSYSDKNGNYSFSNLIPGKWKVRVVNADAGGYEIADNNKTVTLTAAEKSTVDFKISKAVRRIKFSKEPVNINLKKN